MKKRLTAILLVACMVITWLPGYVSADDTAISVAPTAEAANSPEENIAIEGETTPASTLLSDSENDSIPVIEADTETLAEITVGGEYAYFQYTPEYTESYTFTSLADADTYGYLYDSDMNELASNDDSENFNFSITYTLEAGNTYVLAARYYSSSNTGSFNVILKTNHSGEGTVITQKTCTEDGLVEYTCSVCGLKYTEVIPAQHDWDEENMCTECGESCIANGTCGDNAIWVLDDEGTLTISGMGDMEDYNRYAPWYDSQNLITSVIVEDGVTSIGQYSFYYCQNMNYVSLPNSITSIGRYAFAWCEDLTSVTIPNRITTIEQNAFEHCLSLTDLIIPDNVTSIASHAFFNCNHLVSVSLGSGIETIGEAAFASCYKLTSANIPDSVILIGERAFADTALTSVTIPSSVTTIEKNAFNGCLSLTEICVDVDNPNYSSDERGVLFNKNQTLLIKAPGTIEGEYIIPQTVTAIEAVSFHSCDNLTNVSIPDGVETIGDGAFYSCGALVSLNIPKSVTSIGDRAMEGCDSLSGIFIDEENTVYSSDDYGVVYDKAKTSLLFAPGGISGHYSTVDSVTTISEGAFAECDYLTSVILGSSVTVIEDAAFSSCSSLERVVLGENVEIIESAAFHACVSLTSVVFGNSVTTIEADAFSHCYLLENITIPDSVTCIGEYAFMNCEALSTVHFGKGVAVLEDNMFLYCNSLVTVFFSGEAPSISDYCFNGNTVTAYYPATNSTWTADVLQSYGGTINWVGLGDLIELDIISTPAGGVVGENPDLSGLLVELVYSNDIRLPVAVKELTISEIDTSTAGKKTVTVSYGELTAEFVYGVHEGGPAVVLDPSTYLESSHNYENSMDETQTLTYPGATGLVLVFSQETNTESGYDFIYVYDGSDNLIAQYSGNQASGLTVEVPGDTVKIRLTSDGSYTEYGYSFTSISTAATIVHTGSAGTAVAPTCTTDGRTAGIICDICGNHVNYETIPALGHSYNDEGVCDRCGYKWFVEGTCGENVTWYLDKTGTLTISGEGAIFNYDWNTMPWYEYQSEILTIVIEDGVISIGDYVFSGCSSLTSIDIPDGVTSIGRYAFSGCSSLTSIDIPGGVTTIAYNAFENCDSLTSVVIPNSVVTIGDQAFSSCSSLASVEIGDSVTTIGNGAFEYCRSLTNVEIGDSVTTIGSYAFNECDSLTSVVIPNNVTSIYGSAFRNCDSLTSMVIPDSVTSISSYTFGNCPSLISVEIPDSVTTIGESAFYYCTSLTGVTIPDSVTSIGEWAFGYCRSMSSVVIPNSVTTIGEKAFLGCSSLTAIQVDESNPSYSSDSQGILYDKEKTTLIQAPGAISALREIPDSVTTIGNGAFYYCDSLTGVLIPGSVTTIGESAFQYCESLTNVEIGDSVTTIGSGAFASCTSLTSIVIGDSVTTIGSDAFQNCDSLISVAIPDSVTTIYGSAFWYCDNLTKIRFLGDAPAIAANSFSGVTATAYYPVDNATWTEEVMQNYGGTITWAPCYVVLEDGTSTEVAPGEEAVIHIDADHTTLVAVYMDDELVDPSNYTVTEGSTIIKFTAEFMATLSEGNHEVFVEFQNGVANATITVVVPAYIPGDINGDGNVNARDVTKLLQHLAEWDVEVVEAALDINGDGNVNVRDVTTLKQYIAGWDVVIN